MVIPADAVVFRSEHGLHVAVVQGRRRPSPEDHDRRATFSAPRSKCTTAVKPGDQVILNPMVNLGGRAARVAARRTADKLDRRRRRPIAMRRLLFMASCAAARL